MKKSLLGLTLPLFIVTLFSSGIMAQDTWTSSELTGFGIPYNDQVNKLYPFKTNLYASVGTDTAVLYSSATGNMGSWVSGFGGVNLYAINAITSTNEGLGYMYIATNEGAPSTPSVYRTVDGSTWTTFYTGTSYIRNVVPFKGLGTVDSIYVFEEGPFGTCIKRAPYDANDPLDTLFTFDTVLDFNGLSTFTNTICTAIHNGALYFGTNNGANIWKSTDGISWLQNINVGNGFGDPDNYEISAMESFGGYIYVGTYNYLGGPQIWRSNDDVTWTMVAQYPGFERITDFEIASGKIWASMSANNNRGKIVKSLDGLTFFVSDSTGFGVQGNRGFYGSMAVYGNNLYFGSQNYYMGGALAPGGDGESTRGGGSSTGGQIWRHCLGVQPTLNLGNDTTICSSDNITLNAGSATSFYWNDLSINQTLVATGAPFGSQYYCFATATNGCDAVDTIVITSIPTPVMTITNPLVAGGITICAGDSVQVTGSVNSNLRIPQTPIHRTCNVPIDYALGNTYDTISVTGITECSCYSLYSVTIDSLYHNYDVDVSIGLYSPSGYFINLSNNASGSNYIGTEFNRTALLGTSNNGNGPFTGQYAPLDPFSSLTGPGTGNWIIQTNDNYVSDNGVLKGWTIRFSVADSIITYTWNITTGLSSTTTLNTTITPVATTMYNLIATNSVGCTDEHDFDIQVPTINITVADDSICQGAATALTGDGPTNYWSPASVSATMGATVNTTATVPTMYYVMDTIGGCVTMDSAMVFVNPAFSITSAAPSICFNDTALAWVSGSGGTMPYSWSWTDGSNVYPNDTIIVSPASTTTYNITATDLIGCSAVDVATINVAPSTDIYGTVSYSGGAVASSNVVLYRYEGMMIHYDTIQVVATDASGNYHFASVNHDDYLIEVFPSASYTTLVPTYYGNEFLWDSATVVMHNCSSSDTMNIMAVEETSFGTGPGFLHGRIVEGAGFDRAPGDPVPGIDVKLGRNPGGQMVTNTQTDGNGDYSYSNVAYGDYTVYVDIPGLGRDSSYTFTVDSANTYFPYLNYIVDSTTIYIVPNAGIGVNEVAGNINQFNVYPNPSKGNATIEYSITENAKVSLGIYNVLGMKMFELANAEQAAGKYKYNIAEQNRTLTSGVYFVTLIVNGKVNIHKIIITE